MDSTEPLTNDVKQRFAFVDTEREAVGAVVVFGSDAEGGAEVDVGEGTVIGAMAGEWYRIGCSGVHFRAGCRKWG